MKKNGKYFLIYAIAFAVLFLSVSALPQEGFAEKNKKDEKKKTEEEKIKKSSSQSDFVKEKNKAAEEEMELLIKLRDDREVGQDMTPDEYMDLCQMGGGEFEVEPKDIARGTNRDSCDLGGGYSSECTIRSDGSLAACTFSDNDTAFTSIPTYIIPYLIARERELNQKDFRKAQPMPPIVPPNTPKPEPMPIPPSSPPSPPPPAEPAVQAPSSSSSKPTPKPEQPRHPIKPQPPIIQ